MERNEAIKALVAAGKTKEIEALVEQESKRFPCLRRGPSRPDALGGRSQAPACADLHRDHHRGRPAAVRDGQQGSTGNRSDAARVFGVEGLPGDPASLAIGRRDAADRVAAATTAPRAARRHLGSAGTTRAAPPSRPQRG